MAQCASCCSPEMDLKTSPLGEEGKGNRMKTNWVDAGVDVPLRKEDPSPHPLLADREEQQTGVNARVSSDKYPSLKQPFSPIGLPYVSWSLSCSSLSFVKRAQEPKRIDGVFLSQHWPAISHQHQC